MQGDILMKKVSYEYSILLIQFIIITFFLLVLSNYYIQTTETNFLKNKMYSTNVLGLNFSEVKTDKNINTNSFTNLIGADCVLYKQIQSNKRIIRAVYLKNDVFDYSSFIKTGRFFTDEDFNSQEAVAVIGFSMEQEIVKKDGIEYIGLEDSLYRVIGIFEETSEDLDNTIYVNLNSYIGHDSMLGLYYIDSQTEKNVRQTAKNIEENLSDYYSISEVQYEQEKEDLNLLFKVIYVLAIITAICNLINSSYYFILRQRYTIAVKKLCGLTNKYMIINYCEKITCILTIGYLAGIFITLIIDKYTILKLNNLNLKHYLFVFLLLIIISMYIVIELIQNNKKVDISANLK